jgi:hypothetical protein
MDRSSRPSALPAWANPTALDLTGCAECGALAEVIRRTVHSSTDGGVELVVVRCVNQHWFNMPAWMLPHAA